MPAKSPPGGGRPLLHPAWARRDAGPANPAQAGSLPTAGPAAAADTADPAPTAVPASPAGMVLYAVDAALTPESPVTDIGELTALASDAVSAGGGHVLDTSHVMFPNGAVTLVLILAESHLAIHTWPEDNLVAIDLFSCGAIDGRRVAGELARLLRLDGVRLQQIERGTAARR
jgi:S-adenosylmethionine decarboxylase